MQLEQVRILISTKFARGSFSALFNNNYKVCVARIVNYCEDYPSFAKECTSLPGSTPFPQINSSIAVAQRGIFLRAILEILKKRGAYASPTESHTHFNKSSKLGLAPLGSYEESTNPSISLSRLVLTYLKSKEENVAYLSELIDFFRGFDAGEVCRCVYALSENIRDKWRRLVMFSTCIPEDINDLYKQTAKQREDQAEDTEIQLCVAGMEYLNVVVPSFEFFLSRLDKTDDLSKYPPLFSADSIENGKWMSSIGAVLTSVEQCAEHLYHFDVSIINALLDQGKADQIEHLFFSGKKDMDSQQKQSHLSRIVFSHVSYIESFRRYYLWYWFKNVPEEKKKPLSELIDDNKRLIAYLVRYLALFCAKAVIDDRSNPPKYATLLENSYLNGYANLARDLYDCDRFFNGFLKRKPQWKSVNARGWIQDSFRKQKSAQIALLDIILDIHNKGYSENTFLSAIEIENERGERK